MSHCTSWAGWCSRTYGNLEPATWLCLAGRVGGGPVLWAVHAEPGPPALVEGADLVVGATTLHLSWAAGHVALTARGDDETTVFVRDEP